MNDEYDYFKNKRTDRLYISKSLEETSFELSNGDSVEPLRRPFRIVSKVIDSSVSHESFRDGLQVSLRITGGQRQELVAKFYEDTRKVKVLTFQKYTMATGFPHKTHFTFSGNEISVLRNFLRNIELLPLSDSGGAKLDDAFVKDIVLTREQAERLLSQQPELVKELLKSSVTATDVANLGYRRDQLKDFWSLLSDTEYFAGRKSSLAANKGNEAVWQDFFERNTWIFGYGLTYTLNAALDGEKLEQVVKGADFASAGKRVDALLKTQGLISALSFGEIKTHQTHLLKNVSEPYRPESWQISSELAGAIAQVQRSVQVSLRNIQTKTEIKSKDGAPTGEKLFLYEPRSFVVLGSLSEFLGPNGINEEKYSSFEMFRRNIRTPEIITFDELYERAKFIVESDT